MGEEKSTINCNSPDPNDCLVWCQVESVPGEIASFRYVKNTKKTTDYTLQTFMIYKKIDSNIETTPIVCKSNVSEKLLIAVKEQLEQLDEFKENKVMLNSSDEIIAALKSYQRYNNLPIGKFDYKTLQSLNINIEEYL